MGWEDSKLKIEYLVSFTYCVCKVSSLVSMGCYSQHHRNDFSWFWRLLVYDAARTWGTLSWDSVLLLPPQGGRGKRKLYSHKHSPHCESPKVLLPHTIIQGVQHAGLSSCGKENAFHSGDLVSIINIIYTSIYGVWKVGWVFHNPQVGNEIPLPPIWVVQEMWIW